MVNFKEVDGRKGYTFWPLLQSTTTQSHFIFLLKIILVFILVTDHYYTFSIFFPENVFIFTSCLKYIFSEYLILVCQFFFF